MLPRLRSSIRESCRQKSENLIGYICNFHSLLFELRCAEQDWQIRPAKCAPDCSESSVSPRKTQQTGKFGIVPGLCSRIPFVSAAHTLVELGQRSCWCATCCEKSHWDGCLLSGAMQDCSWSLLNALQQLHEDFGLQTLELKRS